MIGVLAPLDCVVSEPPYGVVVPLVELVPDLVVGEGGEGGDGGVVVEGAVGTARMLGRLMKPSPAITPIITTSVSFALAPTFKPHTVLLYSILLRYPLVVSSG